MFHTSCKSKYSLAGASCQREKNIMFQIVSQGKLPLISRIILNSDVVTFIVIPPGVVTNLMLKNKSGDYEKVLHSNFL